MPDYCFVEEDIRSVSEQDPLMLQYRYAQRLNRALLCSLTRGEVRDPEKPVQELRGRSVMLRSTCQTAAGAMGLLSGLGASLLEDEDALRRIRYWDRMDLTERTIISLSVSDLKSDSFPENLLRKLPDGGDLFLKTRDKGFSLRISRERFLSGDFGDLLKRYCPAGIGELMLSPWYPIRSDSLGSMEGRFIVLEGRILSASRPLHSVRHAVPRSLRDGAAAALEKIRLDPLFPQSFALDMGIFLYPDGIRADVVEINPLTTAMCYVNNTVFDELADECRQVYDRSGWGCEYCLDYLRHPESYCFERDADRSYAYVSDSRYELLEEGSCGRMN